LDVDLVTQVGSAAVTRHYGMARGCCRSFRVLVQTGSEHGYCLGQRDVFHRSVELPSRRIVNTADE